MECWVSIVIQGGFVRCVDFVILVIGGVVLGIVVGVVGLFQVELVMVFFYILKLRIQFLYCFNQYGKNWVGQIGNIVVVLNFVCILEINLVI